MGSESSSQTVDLPKSISLPVKPSTALTSANITKQPKANEPQFLSRIRKHDFKIHIAIDFGTDGTGLIIE